MQHYKQLFSVVVVVFLLLMQHTIPTRNYIFLITGIVDMKKKKNEIWRIKLYFSDKFLFYKFSVLILMFKVYLGTLETRGGDTIAELFIEKNK